MLSNNTVWGVEVVEYEWNEKAPDSEQEAWGIDKLFKKLKKLFDENLQDLIMQFTFGHYDRNFISRLFSYQCPSDWRTDRNFA